jgi:hypothetical protein
MSCPNCGSKIEVDWVSCPRCGQPLRLTTPVAVVGQIITKVVGGLAEAGLLEKQQEAEKSEEKGKELFFEVSRKFTKDVESLVLDLISDYDRQQKKKKNVREQ